MPEETYYVKGPTYEDKLREKYQLKYNMSFTAFPRWQLAKPLLKLWELVAGREVAGSYGIAFYVGHKVLIRYSPPWAYPNTHPQDRESYKAEIERLKGELRYTRERLRKADDAARTAENYARALRRMEALLDEKGREVRNRR